MARTAEDILAARGVKPTLSPNLEVLATVEALAGTIKRLLFIGVGCQVSITRNNSKKKCSLSFVIVMCLQVQRVQCQH